jgi:hypothetical protein
MLKEQILNYKKRNLSNKLNVFSNNLTQKYVLNAQGIKSKLFT